MFGGHLMVVAIDFDHTIYDSTKNAPLPGAREAINILRECGIKVIIHSCNRKAWIEKCLNNHDIRFDWIWDQVGKPVADLYIDDCGFWFTGIWKEALPQILTRLVKGNPMIEVSSYDKDRDNPIK